MDTSTPPPPSVRRPRRGMMDLLIEFCTTLEGAEAFRSAGVSGNEIRDRLLRIQSWLDDPTPSWQRLPSYSDHYSKVKDVAYDLENLFEDIELELMAAASSSSSSSSSSTGPNWSALLDIQHEVYRRFYDHYGITPFPTTADRLGSIVKFIDQLLDEIKPSRSQSICPHTQTVITVQRPMVEWVMGNLNGLKELIEEESGSFPHHGCLTLLRVNDCSQYISSLKGHFQQFSDPFLPLPVYCYLDLPWYLQQCIDFCSFSLSFPSTPNKKNLTLLWVAEGFVQPAFGRRLEDEACHYFDYLLSMGYISSEFRQYKASCNEFFRFLKRDDQRHIPKNGRHVCRNHYNFSRSDLEAIADLANSNGFRTLLLCSTNYRSNDLHLDRFHSSQFLIPSIVFLKLTNLRVLTLSGVGFWYVPDHISDLLHLRYLDLSCNPFEDLPDSLVNLFRLQTLKVNHTRIESLPKNLHMMVSLRHIFLDLGVFLHSMPQFIGKLFSLQTCENFVVGKQHGYRINELKVLNNLHGKLWIHQLENVTSLGEALEARLHRKKHITSLKLHWCASDKLDVNYDVLEFLQPHYNLEFLEIYNFHKSKFPNWMSDSSFQNLGSVSLIHCCCEQLPAFGQLPCLKNLRIADVFEVKHIREKFYGHGKVKVGFPSLCELDVSHMEDLETWFGFPNCDLPKLEKLFICGCLKLKHLPEMKTLNSLTRLDIQCCPKLSSLPKRGLPANVEMLRLLSCPKLEDMVDSKVGTEWEKIAHIPSIMRY